MVLEGGEGKSTFNFSFKKKKYKRERITLGADTLETVNLMSKKNPSFISDEKNLF